MGGQGQGPNHIAGLGRRDDNVGCRPVRFSWWRGENCCDRTRRGCRLGRNRLNLPSARPRLPGGIATAVEQKAQRRLHVCYAVKCLDPSGRQLGRQADRRTGLRRQGNQGIGKRTGRDNDGRTLPDRAGVLLLSSERRA